MTNAQKETLRFYTSNDYLLINGLLRRASDEVILPPLQLRIVKIGSNGTGTAVLIAKKDHIP